MPVKRSVRSAFLVTVSTLALSACQSEGGDPPATPPHGNPPPQDPPAATAAAPTAAAPTAPVTNEPPIHVNPPPPRSEISYPMNPKQGGAYVVTNGSTCTIQGQHDPVPCPALMKDPAWKQCSNETIFMKGDASSCYCEHHGNPPFTAPVPCPAPKPTPWPPE